MRWLSLIALAVVLAASESAASVTASSNVTVQNGSVGPAYEFCDVRRWQADCTGATDSTTALANAIAARAGADVCIPDDCTLLIATPGEGDPSSPCGAAASGCSFVLPSRTHLHGFGGSAAILLAGKVCSGGHYPGAACTGTGQCLGGGTCAVQGALSSAYAPTSTKKYYVFTAATGAVDVSIEKLRIVTQQMDPYFRCSTGTNDGAPCLHTCSLASSVTCDNDSDCSTFSLGSCVNLADCKTAGSPGVCGGSANGENTGASYEPGAPAGIGKVIPIDLTNGTNSLVRDVFVYDHKYGPVGIKIGTGLVEHVDTTKWTTSYPVDLFGVAPQALPVTTVTDGIVATGAGAVVATSIGSGTNSCITISGAGKVRDVTTGPAHTYDVQTYGVVLSGVGSSGTSITATITSFGSTIAKAGVLMSGDNATLSNSALNGPTTAATICATASSLCLAGVEVSAAFGQEKIDNVQFASINGALTRGVVTTVAGGVLNGFIRGSRFINVQGAAIAWSGAGLGADGNYFNGGVYLSCGTSCSNRGTGCARDSDCTSCNTGDKCVPEPVIALGSPFSATTPGVAHPTISNSMPLYRANSLKQCSGGTDGACGATGSGPGCTCTTNGNCQSNSCVATTLDLIRVNDFGSTTAGMIDGKIVGNNVLFGNATSPMRFLNLGALTSGNSVIAGLAVTGNNVDLQSGSAASTGIVFPATASYVTGFDGRGNTWDGGAAAASLTSVSGFAWSMGTIDNLPEPAADQVSLLRLTNKTGSTATVGDVVVAEGTTANSVKQAPANTTAPVAGVFLTAAANSATAKVAGPGSVVTVNIVSGQGATYGDLLSMWTSGTAGQFAKALGAPPAAVALGAQSGTTVRALLLGGASAVTLVGGGQGLSTSATRSWPVSGFAGATGTEANAKQPWPVTTFTKLACILSANVSASASRTCTLRVNGADSALTCTIGAAAKTCTDAAHTVTTTAGDELDVQSTIASGSPGAPDVTTFLYGWSGYGG